MPVVSSATPSADSAVVPASVIPELIPLSAEGYGSVRAHPAVAPSLDMWFNESCKVYGFIFAIVPRVKSLPGHKVQCDKCQFFGCFGPYNTGLRQHRQEKHRIWECLCCGTAFPNSSDFKNHIESKNCVLHPFGKPYLGCGSDDPLP